MLASTFAILVTLGIVLSLVFEAARFFDEVPFTEFLFGLHWSPQTALRADQVGSSGSFGAVPVFVGTLLDHRDRDGRGGPIGLLSAIYMTFYADARTCATWRSRCSRSSPASRRWCTASSPPWSVAPFVRDVRLARSGSTVAVESALAAGLVMGIMIIPFISSLSDDAITAVPDRAPRRLLRPRGDAARRRSAR